MLSRHHVSLQLLIPYLLLSAVSLAMLSSIAPDKLLQQLVFVLVGLGLFIYFSRQDFAVYSALSPLTYPLSLLLLFATLVFAEPVRGSTRWIELGSFQFQPSELVKPLLILSFSYFLLRFVPHSLARLLTNIVFLLIPFLLILFQPDLGTALVIGSIFAFELLLADLPWRYLLGGLALVAVSAFFAPRFLAPYQLDRLESFVDPAGDPLGSGYNVIQSVIAVGSGGFWGRGLGDGTQSHLRFLPERHTDFMFASLSEELGFIGSVFVLSLLTYMIFHLLARALHTHGQDRLILAGVAGYLFFQTFINIGMNIGLAPVTGVTLPMVSYGGSSILGVSVALGLAASILSRRPLSPTLEIV